jgi:crotonobetainyl-CoA:carnitine CoA-transferase CaiB-like acyl-CoA transferase
MRPLDGILILDLSRVLACPFATMLLAEMGAEVIKVEQPGSGDETRGFEPFAEGPGGAVSGYFMACNRAKRSITVNMRHARGQAILRDLAAKADVVVENFPTGLLNRYGLDHAALVERNPDLITVSCTGFGQTGPYAKRKGYDTVFQAMAGLMGLTGERGGGPVKPGLPVADLTSGLFAAIAILTALLGRERGGRGTQVDLSMFDAQVALLTIAGASRPRAERQFPVRRRPLAAHHCERPALGAAVPGARPRYGRSRCQSRHQCRPDCSARGGDAGAERRAREAPARGSLRETRRRWRAGRARARAGRGAGR